MDVWIREVPLCTYIYTYMQLRCVQCTVCHCLWTEIGWDIVRTVQPKLLEWYLYNVHARVYITCVYSHALRMLQVKRSKTSLEAVVLHKVI